jgi:GrpB-like predicted nucleotidyltransferase (UPF0157 family)
MAVRVEIVAYDPRWPALFAAERDRVAPLLGGGAEIHHIGSTAVPGLAAKAIVDLMALLEDPDERVPALVAQAGYVFPEDVNAGLDVRRFLYRPAGSARTHHLHLTAERAELDRHLRFRDRLRADPALAADYAQLKRRLAARFGEDRHGYAEAKTAFIGRSVPAR